MNNHNKQLTLFTIGLLILLQASGYSYAETKIAILDFELKDLTLAPGIPAEIERTASIQPMLEGELEKAGYQIVRIDRNNQERASSGVGYLFDHHDEAAKLGSEAGVAYIFVGRLHKPSFLFAYLMGHLIRVNDGKLLGNYLVEIKGSNSKLTIKAVESLTDKIDGDLDNRYTPPPPARAAIK